MPTRSARWADQLEGLYFGLDGADMVALVELPDAGAAAALNLSAGASGTVRTRTTALLTPAELDEALARGYRAPGR